MELKDKKIVFLGDSITQGIGASDLELCYVNRFAAMTGAKVVNYGIGGTRIARRRVPHENPVYDQDFCSRYHTMDDDADIVVVFGGTNDYGHGDAPLGNMWDRDVRSFYGACHVLFSSLVAKYPGKPIVIMTPMHRVTELDKVPSLRAFVQAEREVAEFYSIPVLDLWSNLGICAQVPEQKALYFKDLVHPNDAGHEKIAYTLKRFLENM
jgi:lysophospholipase L1-like esterase